MRRQHHHPPQCMLKDICRMYRRKGDIIRRGSRCTRSTRPWCRVLRAESKGECKGPCGDTRGCQKGGVRKKAWPQGWGPQQRDSRCPPFPSSLPRNIAKAPAKDLFSAPTKHTPWMAAPGPTDAGSRVMPTEEDRGVLGPAGTSSPGWNSQLSPGLPLPLTPRCQVQQHMTLPGAPPCRPPALHCCWVCSLGRRGVCQQQTV